MGQQTLFARRAGEELCSLAFEELLVAVIDVGERVRLLLQVIARREAVLDVLKRGQHDAAVLRGRLVERCLGSTLPVA